jgi:hypothetical protein
MAARTLEAPPPNYRLIWGDNGPAPFESGWSIFAKLTVLNLEMPYFLVESISRQQTDADMKYPRMVRHKDSRWIDFERFSYALGVDERRLRDGFLGQLGFRDDGQGVQIRHCPECIRRQYHSVLFNLEALLLCPWHGIALVECKVCSSFLGFSGAQAKRMRQLALRSLENKGGTCQLRCGHLSISLNQTTVFNRPSPELSSKIELKTKSILAWWKNVLSADSSYPLLSPLHFSNINTDLYFNMEALISGAVLVAGEIPFDSLWEPMSIRWMRWNDAGKPRFPVSTFPEDSIRSVYKSIRRHVYRRYVKKHRGCLNEILHADNRCGECLLIECACTLSLAFIAWRMHNESVDTPEGFRKVARRTFSACSPQTGGLGGEAMISVSSAARFFLGSFFGAWAYVAEVNLKANLMIRKEMAKHGLLGHLTYVSRDGSFLSRKAVGDLNTSDRGDECLIYRDPSSLAAFATSQCFGSKWRRGDIEVFWGGPKNAENWRSQDWTACAFSISPNKRPSSRLRTPRWHFNI